MSETLFQEILAVVFFIPGLLLLVWGAATRQFQGAEAAKYAMLQGEDIAPGKSGSGPRRTASPFVSRLFFTVITTIFAFVIICPWIVFLFVALSAAHGGAHMGAAESPVSPYE